jgi:hypothetical protein
VRHSGRGTGQVTVAKNLPVDLSSLVTAIKKGLLRIDCLSEDNLLHYANLLNQIRRVDRLPETTDVRIITCSMVDRSCYGLITFERKLIESGTIRKFIDEHVNFKSRYTITEQPFWR